MNGVWKAVVLAAAERAVAQVDLSVLKGRKVFVQERFFKGCDEINRPH